MRSLKKIGPVLLAVVLTAAAGLAVAQTAPAAPAGKTGPVTAEEMEGLSFEGLTETQKKQVVAILNGNNCNCSCGMTLGRCRRDDSTCGTSLRIAKQVIDLAKAGRSSADIVKTAIEKPKPAPAAPAPAPAPKQYVSFEVPAGQSVAEGPPNAKVTLVHFLDFQ